MVVDGLARAYNFLNCKLLTRFTVSGTDPLLWSRPQLNQKALGCSHNIHAIISPQDHTLFCQIGIAAFSTQPSKDTDVLSPSVHDR